MTDWLARLREVRAASRSLRSAPALVKNAVLNSVARELIIKASHILEANSRDLQICDQAAGGAIDQGFISRWNQEAGGARG